MTRMTMVIRMTKMTGVTRMTGVTTILAKRFLGTSPFSRVFFYGIYS